MGGAGAEPAAGPAWPLPRPGPGAPGALTAAEVAHWREHGYVVARGVFTRTEAAALRDEAHRVAARLRARYSHTPKARAFLRAMDSQGGWPSAAKVAEGPRALVSVHNVQFHSAAFTRMICDPRLADRAADLIGPNVQLHHTKMFIKPPGIGAPFPLHQDVAYFEHRDHSMVAAIIHLDDSTAEKGCVRVVPGSPRLGALPHIGRGSPHLSVERHPLSSSVPCEAGPGDVLFFSYLCIHGSAPNRHPTESRTTVLVQLRDPEDRSLEPVHLSRGQGTMLRGIDPTFHSGMGVEGPPPRRHPRAQL